MRELLSFEEKSVSRSRKGKPSSNTLLSPCSVKGYVPINDGSASCDRYDGEELLTSWFFAGESRVTSLRSEDVRFGE